MTRTRYQVIIMYVTVVILALANEHEDICLSVNSSKTTNTHNNMNNLLVIRCFLVSCLLRFRCGICHSHTGDNYSRLIHVTSCWLLGTACLWVVFVCLWRGICHNHRTDDGICHTCYLSGRFTLYKGHSQWDTNTYRNWKMKLNYENCVVAHNLSRISLTSTTI